MADKKIKLRLAYCDEYVDEYNTEAKHCYVVQYYSEADKQWYGETSYPTTQVVNEAKHWNYTAVQENVLWHILNRLSQGNYRLIAPIKWINQSDIWGSKE